jgi:signal transduction histidine kinase
MRGDAAQKFFTEWGTGRDHHRQAGLLMEGRWEAIPVREGKAKSSLPSVRAARGSLVAARQPTAIGWGSELLQVHNDAFATIIGARADPGVGEQSLRDLCGDLWPRLVPLVERAMRLGESGVLDDQLFCTYRHGGAEESYLTCTCTPLLDDDDAIGGVMISVTESTEHVLSVRRTAALHDIAAAAATPRSVAAGCRHALAAVAAHSVDIPFALLYLRDAERDRVRLVATAGLAPGAAASPHVIELGSPDDPGWPVAAALRTNEPVVVDDLLVRFGTLPAGEWPFAPKSAMVVPLTSPGRDEPDGVFVAGMSARHEPDAQSRSFIELVVKQIAAAIAGGRVHEDEERHAAARIAGQLARAKRRARMRALKARFAGILEERTRLAREIHDTLLQGVTGIALQLGTVLPQVRTSPDEAADALERIVELALETSRSARQAVWDIRPPALADGDFAHAAETAAQRIANDAGIAVTLSMSGDVRPLPLKHQSVVLRVVQEAVTNAVRHAHARMIRLHLAYGARRFHVAVSDDGRGFEVDPDFRSYEGHWGLLGMQERASSLGGALTVQSAPERGTTVKLLLPYRTRMQNTSPA